MGYTERDQAVIWHPYTQMKNAVAIPIVRGDGAWLFDENGTKYIDAVSSWWVNLHGHANAYIAEKIAAQAKVLEHVIFAGFTHPVAIGLAERLLGHLPENQKKIFYSDNGSTAVEVALKMAVQYWNNLGEQRNRIIAFKDSYHGDTFGAMSASGRGVFTAPFRSFMFDVDFIDVPVKGKEMKTVEQLRNILKRGDAAAFIFEPLVLGAGGMLMYHAEILNELMEICHKHHVLAIADEVMTGFYRTGKFLATDHIAEKPDIYCLSKGLTGGTMALGVTSCTWAVFDAFLSDGYDKTLYHGHSYTANPIACAAAAASLDLLEKQETLDAISRIARRHSGFVNEVKDNTGISDIRQTGTILAIDIRSDNVSSYTNSLRNKLYDFFIGKGIVMRPLGNVIYLIPPYCISDEDLSYIYNSIIEFLNQHIKEL